jgi:hypothetical protein
MMTPKRPALGADDLTPELLKQLEKRIGKKVRVRRSPAFPMDEVRRYAIRCLAVLADLRPNERRRVLAHAQKLNDV